MTKKSGLAITSLVMGILGLFIPIIFSLAAIVLGIIAISKIKKDPDLKGKGLAIAGLIIGIIGLVSIAVFFLMGMGIGGGLLSGTVITTGTPQMM